jgi:NADPH:quinone reductase-like Zn-dependent oxidoreductase
MVCARLSCLGTPSSAQLCEIAKLVDAGKLKPVVETVLPLSDADAATN